MDLTTIGIVCAILLLGIIVVLKKGFNEVIKGMEAINEKLKRLENRPEN